MRTLAVALLLVAIAPRVAVGAQSAPAQSPASVYFCPMHVDVTSKAPGTCSKCGMALVAGDPWNEREYVLDLETMPAAPKPGVPVRLRLAVLDPDSRRPVTDFAVVHDKRYHLFVVSQNLEHFAHIHPEQQSDGSWAIEHVLPTPGYYRIYSDFLPIGGTPQVIARTLATAGYDGDLMMSIPRLAPDRTMVKEVDGTTVRLAVRPTPIVAGRTVRLHYDVSANGSPATDLEPYLGAWGHTLVLSEDAFEYVHAHPIEYLPPDAKDAKDLKGGPTITFDATFPKPGRYRVWTQFKRRGTVSTTSFTVEAIPAPAAP